MIVRRIINLWKWSGIDPEKPFEVEEKAFKWSGWIKPINQKQKMATIIDLDEKPTFDLKDEQL